MPYISVDVTQAHPEALCIPMASGSSECSISNARYSSTPAAAQPATALHWMEEELRCSGTGFPK